MATGAITWKLGGSAEPESLNVVGDQYVDAGSALLGPAYARLAADGSLTVHDDGTSANRAPRALRFAIDTSTNTATEVEQMTDPRATTAVCCGSAEKLPGGDWVISWGPNDFMTELNPQGVPQLTITYPGFFSYRAVDVPATVASLREGMDAMVPPSNVSSGYWKVASDGGVFAYGAASFYGSAGDLTLNTAGGGHGRHPRWHGYWLVASDGGIFAFGDAGFFGSTGASP